MTTAVATSPEDLAALFVRHFTEGDLDALAALYTDDAIFVVAPGTPVQGRAAISAALGQMRAAGASIALELRRVHVAGDTAVLSNTATVSGITPDGSDVVAPTTEVMRREGDGSWRYVLDDPFFSA
ncbi:SgcJ/EcaC family oxidoreductase [Pseudonocardia sp. N23]|uniref:YybH family protein n=1 Tax=Pseudonocardia sp. N23 TaxID=1987376 RepID=UPI000C0360DB|nr:SgcJ/EcaC family oxidoreductase [Pseudonocardia sp. N23]GAY07390.1 ketosteroid isomerase-like protein [Pseudonocardia sp. N23]